MQLPKGLHSLDEDISEQKNLYSDDAERAEEMQARLNQILEGSVN